MSNLQKEKCIPLDDYLICDDVCCEECKPFLDLIKSANALINIDDTDFVDIEAYDRFILSRLEDLRGIAEKDNDYSIAFDYAHAANVYFYDRSRFIRLVAFNYADYYPNKRKTFKREYEFASAILNTLCEHFTHAHDLLFKSTPTPADSHNPKDSTIGSTDNE